MDKNVVIVFFFTMLLLLVAQQFFIKPQPPTKKTTSTTPSAPNGAAAIVPAANPTVAPIAASRENTTVIENSVYKITFTNRGALVKSWILKKYKNDKGQPLDLVQQPAASQYGYPLSLWTLDATLKDKLNGALYEMKQSPADNGQDLSFAYSDGDVVVHKDFHFDQSYAVGVKTSVQRGSNYLPALPAWPAGFGDATGLPSYAEQMLNYELTDGSVKQLKLDRKGSTISGNRLSTASYQWLGASDAYFTALFLPEQADDTAFIQLRNSLEVPKDAANPQGEKTHAELLGAAAGKLNGPTSVRLFAGPKSVDVLESLHTSNGSTLRGVLDYGWFGFIGRPLFAWVRWTERHWTPNWGWTIVLVTIIINIALLPLRITQIKSSMKMQKVAPQMQAIQEKYKKYKLDDPRRGEMQKEVAALYKEHGVNPIGGCLPLLIQMPFLFAFYSMLKNAIELRQANWLYLTDLSAPDHLHIIPIATIILLFIMQRMMPSAGMSKEQQRMMYLMTPLMFAMFTWSVASGLGLYIITGTAVQIVQQWVMNQTEMGREMRAMAEKRAQKAAAKRH